MDYPIHVYTICMVLSILRVACQFFFIKNEVFLSLKIVFILANIADPDEMPLISGISSGSSLFPKYLFVSLHPINDLSVMQVQVFLG